MADRYKVKKATSCSLFRDIVLLNDKEEAVHIYTQDSTMVEQFVGHCVYYDGSTKEARKALELETYMELYKFECAQRCTAMKNLFLAKAPLNSRVWDHTPELPKKKSSVVLLSSDDDDAYSAEELYDYEAGDAEEEVFIMPPLPEVSTVNMYK